MKSLKNLIEGCQKGREEDKKELMVRFLPLIRKVARCMNRDVSREDLEQDLWVYFWQCVVDFDLEKAEHFPAILCCRLSQHRKYLLRSWSRRHEVEGRALDDVDEESYDMNLSSLWMDEWKRLLQKAGCSDKQIQVAMALATYESVKDVCQELGMSQQSLYRYKTVLRSVCERNPKILDFLKI